MKLAQAVAKKLAEAKRGVARAVARVVAPPRLDLDPFYNDLPRRREINARRRGGRWIRPRGAKWLGRGWLS